MISRFKSWYCRVKVTQRQDGAGTYTAHLQLQHLVYTDTGKTILAAGAGKLYISSFQAPMFVASMTAKTGSLRSPTVKFTFLCLMRSIFSLTRALTFNSQSPTSQPRFRAGEESLRNICSFILILLCFQTDSPRHFCQPHPTGEGEGWYG